MDLLYHHLSPHKRDLDFTHSWGMKKFNVLLFVCHASDWQSLC